MISIIIINYNSIDYLYKNIKSIINSDLKDINYEIIVVDNNSKIKPTNEDFNNPFVQFFLLEQNKGYAAALNYGISKSKGDYILASNADVYFKNNSIKNLYSYYLNRKPCILGSKVLSFNGRFQKSSRRRFPFFRYIIPHVLLMSTKYNYLNYDTNKTTKVDSISGCCMFFSRFLYDKVKGFDERFFLYFEDTDFCIKSFKMGYKTIYYPKSQIFHFKHGSRNFKNYLYVKYHFYKSFFIFIKKYSNYYLSTIKNVKIHS